MLSENQSLPKWATVAGLARLYYPSAYTYSYSGVYEFYKVAPSYREWEPKRFLLEINLVLGSVPRAPSPLISRSCWNTKSGIVNCSRGTYLKSSNNLSTYTTFFQTCQHQHQTHQKGLSRIYRFQWLLKQVGKHQEYRKQPMVVFISTFLPSVIPRWLVCHQSRPYSSYPWRTCFKNL
jgi:hypothetical protein